ncbi:hypothetical protein HPB48_010306 [Haemaphysalis longicornis]|uniref:Rapamycin-insensitive companion of mTOR n=1 Tax=Haemaphysalis longicornis TaxID=44386 RepID=A0A9J6FWX3_HAELO|nr:hypothetical protein HPB48_010306 [Haemaphysalis longicornis]
MLFFVPTVVLRETAFGASVRKPERLPVNMAHVMFRQRSSRGGRSLRSVADNLREILIYLVRQDGVTKQRKLAFLNCLVKLSPKIVPEIELGLTLEDLFCCLRVLLVHEASEVRAGCLRALRHLVRDAEAARALVAAHVPLLVARALDAALESRTERLQALRLVRRLVAVAPHDLPPQLGARSCGPLLNPRLCVETGGFRTLLQGVLDCPHPPLAEAMLSVIFHSINDPATRQLLARDIDLEYLVAPFTDSHFRYGEDAPENSLSDDRELRFQASRIAMTSVLRSWPGMVYFCKPPPSGLQSLVEVLCLPLPETRKNILALLFDVFCLRPPEWTSDFEAAIKSAGLCLTCTLFSSRSNLVANYLALLLLAFVQAGILEALVEVIVSSEEALAIQATILLAELLYMASVSLPSEASRHCHCLPTLMSQAAAFGSAQEKRIRASTAVARLSRLHALRRKGIIPCSLFLDQLLQFCSPTRAGAGGRSTAVGGGDGGFCEAAGRARLQGCLRRETDEGALRSIRDSLVLSREYNSWDWYLVSTLLRSPSEALRALAEGPNRAFVRRLVHFYKPSSRQFSLMEAKRRDAHQVTVVGCQLVEFLLEAEEARGGELLEDLLGDLCACLAELGPGGRLLERLGLYQQLAALVGGGQAQDEPPVYLKLVLASLDYTKPGMARSLLSTALTAKSEESRLYATKFLRVLLRLELLDFRKWVLELLVTQLCDPSRAVMLAAASILDEACDLRVDHLRYVKIVEDFISQAVTWHQRGDDGTYGRRSSNTRLRVQDVFAPGHLYGQLAQHREGLEFLQKHGSLERHWDTIRAGDMSTPDALLALKASLWTAGHVGTSPEGFALVAEADLLPCIVKMARDSPVYSIRGVCFYVLCLLATTADSVEPLGGLGWDCVQHGHREAWPVAADSLRNVQTSPAPLRAHTWSVSSAGSQWSEVLTASALHRRFHGSTASSLCDGGEPRRAPSFASTEQQQQEGGGVRHSQTLPRNVTLSPRHDALVASSRRPRSSSDCRPGEARQQDKGGGPPQEPPALRAGRVEGAVQLVRGQPRLRHGDLFHGQERQQPRGEGRAERQQRERHDGRHEQEPLRQLHGLDDQRGELVRRGGPRPHHAQPHRQLHLPQHPRLGEAATTAGHWRCLAGRGASWAGVLARGSASSVSPTSPDSPVLMYTSARDVAGYATLRAVREASSMRRRRKRVCSVGCDVVGGDPVDLFGSPHASWSLDRGGFYIGEEPCLDDAASTRTLSVSSNTSGTKTVAAGRADEDKFMGLCLPVDTALIFTVCDDVRPPTDGAAEEPPSPPLLPEQQSVEEPERSDGFELHTPQDCLLCHSVERVARMKRERAGGPDNPVGPVGGAAAMGDHCNGKAREAVAAEAFPFSRSSQSRKNRRPSDNDYDAVAVRREMLKYIANLNSSVVMKGSEQALLTLKQKYPGAFQQDVCLYSEVCLLMSRYRYRLAARTLVQELFFDLRLEQQFLEEAENILRIPHVVMLPPKEESEA